MVDLGISSNFAGINRLSQQLAGALVVGVQEAAVEVQEIGRTEVVNWNAFDTYAIEESIYVSGYGYSDYEDRANEAADALLNNPTNWPEIRQWRIDKGISPFLPLDPEQKVRSKYEAVVGVAATHGKYVESGYISWWYGNWVPARPFWRATIDAARPKVIAIIWKNIHRVMQGQSGNGAGQTGGTGGSTVP